MTHDATFRKSLTVEGDATLSGPAKITGANTLEFGAGVSGKQGDAGKIGYAVWDNDSLNIVGAGTKAEGRKITFFAEGAQHSWAASDSPSNGIRSPILPLREDKNSCACCAGWSTEMERTMWARALM